MDNLPVEWRRGFWIFKNKSLNNINKEICMYVNKDCEGTNEQLKLFRVDFFFPKLSFV